MKMIILAGGQRSAISDDAEGMPKPMISIGGRPLLWHIMKHASLCGVNEFVICGGYKIDVIKDYFLDFYIYQSDIQVDTGSNIVKILDKNTEEWKVTVVDTGIKTMPIERVKRVLDLSGDEFFITYGDCLSDISLKRLEDTHRREGKMITVAAAMPSGRKMPLHFLGGNSAEWKENDSTWTSAGVFVARKDAFAGKMQNGDIENLLSQTTTAIYRHKGFFNTIETLRDKSAAEELWETGQAPWMGVL